MECAKKRSHDPVFHCLIGWACAQNLCHSRQKVAIYPPCPNSNLQPHPWRVANLRYCFWQRRCLHPDKARYRCREAYCGGNKRYCLTGLRCLRSKKSNGNRVHFDSRRCPFLWRQTNHAGYIGHRFGDGCARSIYPKDGFESNCFARIQRYSACRTAYVRYFSQTLVPRRYC